MVPRAKAVNSEAQYCHPMLINISSTEDNFLMPHTQLSFTPFLFYLHIHVLFQQKWSHYAF